MTPLTFGSCFGWLHEVPSFAAQRTAGIVLCGPVGFEKQATHRGWRLLAERLADAGFPVLRFDYPATGDSAGNEADPDLIALWVASIDSARAELATRTGVISTVLCGLHLGALLAVHSRPTAITGESTMVLLAPQSSGRRLIRMWQLIANVTGASTVAHVPPADARVEAAGLRLSSEATTALRRLDIQHLAVAPASHILLFDDPAQAASASIAPALEAAGARVQREVFPELERYMQDAHRSQPPNAVWSRVVEWLVARTATASPGSRMDIRAEALELADGTVEQVVVIGAADVRGIYTANPRSLSPSPHRMAVLFCNTGCNPHYGPGRVSLHLARALASYGVASLRFDLPGIGDSELEDEDAPLHLYTVDRNAIFKSAVDALAIRGHDHIALLGTCSGAYHAMRAAQADCRIRHLVLINQLIYEWIDRPLSDIARYGLARLRRARRAEPAEDSLAALFEAQTSKTLLAWQQIRRISFRLTASVQWIRVGRAASFHDGLIGLAARGVRIMVAVGATDPSRTLLEGTFGDGARDLLSVGDTRLIVDTAFDHSMASAAARLALWPALTTFLDVSKSDHFSK